MKKDQNRSDFNNNDHSLPRTKILRGRRNFQRLFEKSTVLNSNTIQFRYRLFKDPSEGCLIGFIAPKKKMRSAVKRNKTKRLLRECYRTNQQYLQDFFAKENFGMHGVFIAQKDGLTFDQIRTDMISILKNMRERLERVTQKKSNSDTD